MEEKLFDTVFETSLRFAILMDELGEDASEDYLRAIDFMSLYAKDFDAMDTSINGTNPYMFCEYVSRRQLDKAALRELVLKGYVKPVVTHEGFYYGITFDGHAFASSLKNAFATKYRAAVEAVIKNAENIGDDELIDWLNQEAEKEIVRFD